MGVMLLALAVAGTVCPPAWATAAPYAAAKRPAIRAALKPGDAVALTLLPLGRVRLPVEPGKAPKPGTFSGLATLDVVKAGKLTVTLSSATYVDLVRDGKTIPSVAHGMGGPCATMHKRVTFDVAPGTYTLQLTGAPEARVVLMTSYE
jgi:hypothetical protein